MTSISFVTALLELLKECQWSYGRSTLRYTPELRTVDEIHRIRYYIAALCDSLVGFLDEDDPLTEDARFQALESHMRTLTYGEPEDGWKVPAFVQDFVLRCIRERRVPQPGDDDYPDYLMG